MTSKIESTKREMYRALAALKAGGRWLLKKQNAEAFESALEEHLEASRQELDRWKASDKKTGEMILFKQGEAQRERAQHQETQRQLHEMTHLRECFETLAVDYTKKSVQLEDENKSLKARLDEALCRVEIYGDAHRYQVKLTHEACVRERVLSDDLFETKRDLAGAKYYKQDCIDAEASADRLTERVHQQKILIAGQRHAIAELFMTNRVLVRQVEALAHEVDLLNVANRAAGDQIRSAFDASFDRCIPQNSIMVVNGEKAHLFRVPE